VVDPDGRDGCRAPIPWTADGDDEDGHGWPARPWLPFPVNASTHAADVQAADPDSMLVLYRRLLALRRESIVLRRGSFETIPSDDLFRYVRRHGDDAVHVVVNLGDEEVDWPADLDDVELLVASGVTSVGAPLAPAAAAVVRPARGER
jgi:alpha-glucosidase